MATTTADLLVRIDATTEQLRRELNRGEAEVKKFQTGIERALGNIDKAFGGAIGNVKNLLGLFGVAAGAAGLVSLGKQALEFAGNINNASQRLGIGVEALQEYTEAAKDFGIETGTVETAIKQMNVAIGEAVSGDENAQKKFKALGIEFKDAAGNARRTEAVMRDLADVISRLPSPAERAAAAAELLGTRAGPEMVALLQQGGTALTKYLESMKEAGRVMDEETTKRLAHALDVINNFHTKVIILYGETLDFIARLGETDAPKAAILLENVNKEITNTKKAIADLEDAGPVDSVLNYFGELERQQSKLTELYQRQAQYINIIDKGRTKDDVVTTPTTTSTVNLGGTTTEMTEAQKAAERLQNAIDGVRTKISALNAEAEGQTYAKLEAEAFGSLGVAIDAVGPKYDELRAALLQQSIAIEENALAAEAYKAALEGNAEGVRKWEEEMSKGKAAIEALRTPYEVYQDDLKELTRLYDEGAIPTLEQYNELTARTAKRYNDSLDKTKDKTTDFADAAKQSFDVIGNAFEDAVLEGAKLRDIMGGLARDIARVMLRIAITKPLENWVSGLFTTAVPSAAEGGVIGPGGPIPLRRYLGGGIATHPQMALFGDVPGGRPEAFVPLPDGRSIPVTMSGGGGNSVSVTNNVTVQGGKASDAAKTGEIVSRAMTEAMQQFFDQRLQYQMQPRGLLRPSTVS